MKKSSKASFHLVMILFTLSKKVVFNVECLFAQWEKTDLGYNKNYACTTKELLKKKLALFHMVISLYYYVLKGGNFD